MAATNKISADTVRADFNDPIAVVHYARAAHFLGLWKSELLLIEPLWTPNTGDSTEREPAPEVHG